VDIKPVTLDQFSAKALVDNIRRIPGDETLADVFRRSGGRMGIEIAEGMFRRWGSSLGSAPATESFVFDCMIASGFKYDLIREQYYHPKYPLKPRRARARKKKSDGSTFAE
jgi:hypothetical protein